VTFHFTITEIVAVLGFLGTVVGYLANTKTSVILLKAAVKKAHQRIDAIEARRSGPKSSCNAPTPREERHHK
jgi:hypothetical protein